MDVLKFLYYSKKIVTNDFLLTFLGILHNFLAERNTQTEAVGNKLAALLKDENHFVRVKAATALGYFFGDI